MDETDVIAYNFKKSFSLNLDKVSLDIKEEVWSKIAEGVVAELRQQEHFEQLCSCGYYHYYVHKKTDYISDDWLNKNIKGVYHRFNNRYLFEDEKDLSWFILSWS